MRALERGATRRAVMAGTVAAALAWAGRGLVRAAPRVQAPPTFVATAVDRVPSEPDDPLWAQAAPATVPLNPQQVTVPRLKEAGTKEIGVRGLYDAERLALLLEWQDAHKNVDLGTVLQYRDAVAVQFPEDSSRPTPSFTMGEAGNGVVIYHWKSDWQFGPLSDVDEAYPNMYGDIYLFSGAPAGQIPEARDYLTKGRKEYLTAAAVGNPLADPDAQAKIGPVQKMRAEGFGTLEPNPVQDGAGKGAWQDGVWRILLSIPRQQSRFTFLAGTALSVGFAVWDGSRKERNGQKAFSYWQTVSLGPVTASAQEAGGGLSLPVVGGVAAGLAAVALLIALRRRRTGAPPTGPQQSP